MKRVFCLAIVLTISLALVSCAAPRAVPLPPTSTPSVATAAPTLASLPSPTAPARLLLVRFRSQALAHNLLGDLPDRILRVYLPPSYYTTQQRYPVIYYLPGFGDENAPGLTLPDDIDLLIARGGVKEMIVVVASGANALGDSFYVNSPVTGAWDDYLTKDVVRYVDAHYRTLPQPASRGIAGHASGGFGALNLAMLHPDVFGAVYAVSPTLFDPDGLASAQEFASPQTIADMVDAQARESVMPAEAAYLDMKSVPEDIRFSLAYAAAFAPDPARNPPYDYPYRLENGNTVRDDAVWQRWQNGFGALADKIQAYRANLLELNGIAFDYGLDDPDTWMRTGCEYFSAQLTLAGIPNRVVGFTGDPRLELGNRMRAYVLPFFSQRLVFAP